MTHWYYSCHFSDNGIMYLFSSVAIAAPCAPHVNVCVGFPRQKPPIFSSTRFERSFILNGAHKCTCLWGFRGFGISRCVLCASHLFRLCVLQLCQREGGFFHRQGLSRFTLGFVALLNLFVIFWRMTVCGMEACDFFSSHFLLFVDISHRVCVSTCPCPNLQFIQIYKTTIESSKNSN